MATAFSEMATKKKITTYGKASRKKLAAFTRFSDIKQTASELSGGANATPMSAKKLQTLSTRNTTTSASVDVFDFPASDDEIALPNASGKRKIGMSSRGTSPVKRIQTEPVQRQFVLPKNDKVRIKKRSAKMLSQSELRMGAVGAPSNERTAKQEIIQGPARPKQSSLASISPKQVKQGRSKTVEDRMASIALSTPRKTIAASNPSLYSRSATTSLPEKSTSPDRRQPPILPKAKRMWQGSLDDSVHSKSFSSEQKSVVESVTKKPRRRLIDTLMEQREESEEESESEYERESQPKFPQSQQANQPEEVSSSQWEVIQQSQMSTVSALPIGTTSLGPRTYASQRAILMEPVQDFETQLVVDMPLESAPSSRRRGRGDKPSLKPLESLHEAEDDSPGIAIRSVHELRLAGAKKHFADGVEHLLNDIGAPQAKPSSSRRSGLIDLATRLMEKDYRRQFLEHSLEQRLFLHLGQETDMVGGFLIASILFTLLSEGGSSLAVEQLRRQGISRLMVRLLEAQHSISRIIRERQSNMSKSAQSLVLEYQTLLLTSESWEEPSQTEVSPRTMALKCIEIMVKQTREVGNPKDIISKEMVNKLFGILKDSAAENLYRPTKDFQLAMSTIEWDTRKGMSGDLSTWTSIYLPYTSSLILRSLSQEVPLNLDGDGLDCVLTLFKLVASVTLSNEEVSDFFSSAELMVALGRTITAVFYQMSGFLPEDERDNATVLLNHVTNMMVNVVASSHVARQSFDSLEGTENDPLPDMVQIFKDRYESSSQAVSQDEIVENVPFGFLTLALGYLCLEVGIRERVGSQLEGLGSLASKADEVVTYLKRVDELTAAEGGGPVRTSPEQYKSLESMLHNLACPTRHLGLAG